MAKKRISRKKLLSTQDEFQTQFQKILAYILKHPYTIVISLLVLAVILFSAGGIRYIIEKKNNQAITAYNRALASVETISEDQGGVTAVLDSLEKVRKDYKNTAPGHLVLLELGNLYYKLEMYKLAAEAFQEFMANMKKGDKNMRPLILDSLAYIYEAENNFTDAALNWEKILNISGNVLKEETMLNLGRIYEAQNNPQKAKDMYTRLLAEFPESGSVNLVKAKLISLAPTSSE